MFKYFSPIKFFKQRGQVVVFYALMVPLLLMVAGVGLDLGWYYLNVSRLQNAADAAVIAGARTLASDTTNFKNFTYNALVDKYPANRLDDTRDTTNGDREAAKYVLKNLSSDDTPTPVTGSKTYTMKDNYTRGDNTITMTPSLYKDDKIYYYVVHLNENIHHFFLGFLDDMNAKVVAVAKLTYNFNSNTDIPLPPGPINGGIDIPNGTDILSEMYQLENKSVMRNWEWQTYATDEEYKAIMNGAEMYHGNITEFQDKKVHYKADTRYRYEKAEVRDKSPNYGSSYSGSPIYNATEADEGGIDSLNLDFKADIKITGASTKNQFKKDWDINNDIPEDLTLETYNTDGYSGKYDNNYENSTAARNYRVHSTFNFTTPFKVRQNRTEEQVKKNPEDALHVRIESEPIRNFSFKAKKFQDVYSTVRQIFLNINQANTGENDRPLIFYYDGPESYDQDSNYSAGYDPNSHVRDSQPVVLTLNADARVILFAPNSPVVIRGNGHKMQGFVIAKEFHRLTTEADYTVTVEDGVKRYFDKNDSTKEYFYLSDEGTFIDYVGNVQTIPLDASTTRDPDYLAQLKTDENQSNYIEQLESDKDYLAKLKAEENSTYTNLAEMPERADKINDWYYEKVYNLSAFNLSENSYYDSFQVPELKRNIYKYLDNYTDNDKTKSTDMFFTKVRATWID